LKGKSGHLLYRLITRAESIGARLSTAIITVDELLAAGYRKQNDSVIIIGHYPEKSMAQDAPSVFTHSELRFVYVGRLSVDRGILAYTDLLRQVKRAGLPARLILAGVFTPPAEEDLLRASLAGIEDAVEIFGWLPYEQVPALLQTCDIGLCILNPEERYIRALPVKLFEYMACGLPVIASNFPAIASIVGAVRCGALVEPQSSTDGIVQTVCEWWSNPQTPRHLGENGRQAVLNQYNWETLVNRLDDLYYSVLNQP
jgi:glycosyltransferase involved in cell wall biosynthesis